jgi:hypothetical protein
MNTTDTDIVDVLLSQHEQIEQLMAAVATDDDRSAAFDDLQTMLKMHEFGEQKVVHPVTRDAGNSSAIAEESVQEENRADRALAILAGLGVDHPDFLDEFAAFRSDVLNHAKHEELHEFPPLREQLPAAELRAMASRLLDVQAETP